MGDSVGLHIHFMLVYYEKEILISLNVDTGILYQIRTKNNPGVNTRDIKVTVTGKNHFSIPIRMDTSRMAGLLHVHG